MQKDKQIFDLINKEESRQTNGIELIASENYVSKQVMEAMGSVLTNKYAEGLPNKRSKQVPYTHSQQFSSPSEQSFWPCKTPSLISMHAPPWALQEAAWVQSQLSSYSGSGGSLQNAQ